MRWVGLVFAVAVRRVSLGVFDPFVADVMCIGRSATAALDFQRGPLMFVDRVCCSASVGPSQDVCVRAPPRTSSAAVRPRRSMSHGGRRCSSIAVRRGARGITRTVDRPQHGLATSGGSSMFVAFDAFVGDTTCRRLRTSSLAITVGRSPTTALDVPRPLTCFAGIGCAASLGPSIDRSTASQQPGARRCSRRWFVRGARGASSSCRSFRRRCAVPDRTSTTITAAKWSRPTWGA